MSISLFASEDTQIKHAKALTKTWNEKDPGLSTPEHIRDFAYDGLKTAALGCSTVIYSQLSDATYPVSNTTYLIIGFCLIARAVHIFDSAINVRNHLV